MASCTPYPSELKSLEDCCEVPVLFGNDPIHSCEHLCEKDKENPDCPFNCLFKNNNILKNKEINKTAMEDFYDKHGYGDPHWIPITKKGLEICHLEYDEKKSLKDAFEKFEDCMNIHFEENCILFKQPAECDPVEDFMMKCQHVHHDCNVWPKWIVKLPEFCCGGRPELFSKEWLTKSEDYCKKQDLVSKAGRMQCLATFLLTSTEIKKAEKWNFEIATKFLTENSKNDPKWKAGIEKTMEICEKQVHGLNY